MTLTVGSLFAGIGGFDLGFERAGMETVWQVEQDDFCRAVLARHFPRAERFVDVRDVGAANLAPVDLVCGGFPCQDISLAGGGAGIDGARSGLWAEYARIIGELGPRWVVVENVAALTSRGLDRVARDLSALGYDAEWDCIPASAFGAPHRRDRVWLVAYPRSEGLQGAGHAEKAGRAQSGGYGLAPGVADAEGQPERPRLRPSQPGGQRRRRPGDGGGAGGTSAVPDPDGGRGEDGGGLPEGQGRQALPDADGCEQGGRREAVQPGEFWATEPNVGRVADGVPARVDRLSALGNALVP